MNAGRVTSSLPGSSNAARPSELFPLGILKSRLEAIGQFSPVDCMKCVSMLTRLIARDHGMTVDNDALSYLALAAESRLRSLLTASLSAQLHRTTSSHVRAPPLSKSGKPMWSHSATADPTAVLEALNQANREAEQEFRLSRMDRLARETEMQRAKERAERAAAQRDEEDMSDTASQADPGTPSKPSPAAGSGSSPPASGGGSSKKSKKPKSVKQQAKNMSADLQHKMTNATAMSQIGGIGGKKYTWMSSVPLKSSPLAGPKKRKAEGKEDSETPGPGEASPAPDGMEKKPGINGDDRPKAKKSRGEGGDGTSEKGKRRAKLTAPTRREVVVGKTGDAERKVSDDKALTLTDLMFAMEREGVGRGMGTTEEILQRVVALGPQGLAKPHAAPKR